MADSSASELLVPSVFDRLIDDGPGSSPSGARDSRGQSLQELRASVERDLVWLLNCGNLNREIDLEKYPLVASSVLNYGIPELAGNTTSNVELGTFEKLLRQAIIDFEPRIRRESVKVRLSSDHTQMNHNAMVFSIEGELWADPVPIHIHLQAQLDLETGNVDLKDEAGRGLD